MTTFTGNNSFSKGFGSYKPEDDPLMQDADTKALMSGAAQASLSRLAKPGGVWNPEEFDKITKHYLKPIEQQTKQRSQSLQAFFRSRGWMDSGSAPEKNLQLFADAERQAAENVYVPLTLEALRQRDQTAQADIAQAANLGNQRLSAFLQSQGQRFNEYATERNMNLQDRQQLLAEVNSASQRALQAGEQTGRYVDPQTGQSYETLQSKRDEIAKVISLAQETGYLPVDYARASGVPEGEVGGFKLGDFLTAEEIDALRGAAPATGGAAAGAGTSPGAAALSPAQQSYVDTVATNYDMTPDERSQISSLFTSGSVTALQDIQTIVMTAYNRKLTAMQTPPAGPTDSGAGVPASGTEGSTPNAEAEYSRLLTAYPNLTAGEKFELQGALSRGQMDMVSAMEQSLQARGQAAMGRARDALSRNEGVPLADWNEMTAAQQQEIATVPGFRREGGRTPSAAPSPSSAPSPPAYTPTLGKSGDVGSLLGLGGGEPWQDEVQMRSKISALLKQMHNVNAEPGSDLVTRLLRGDTVTL